MADILEIQWEGADGSHWDLLDPLSGVQAVAIEGLGMPGFVQQWAELAAREGAKYEGTTWGVNTVNMTVSVGDGRQIPGHLRRQRDEWRALDAAWKRSVSPERPGRLVVVTGAGSRSLELQLEQPFAPPAGRNPALRGEATYQLQLTAGDAPWWLGEEVAHDYSWASVSEPFFGGASGGVLLYISKSSTTDRASIANPGDRDAWPRWWARGPFTSVSLGVDGSVVRLPFALGPGQKVFVDSFEQTIVNEQGASLWPLMGYANPTFRPIPAGGLATLEILFTSPGEGATLGVAITPRFEGPW